MTLFDEWINALRNSGYEQGCGMLRSSENKFCCLGVAADIYAKHDNLEWVYNPEPGNHNFHMHWERGLPTYTTLPASIAKAFGLERSDMDKLITMNDDQGYSFDQIADWLEENVRSRTE